MNTAYRLAIACGLCLGAAYADDTAPDRLTAAKKGYADAVEKFKRNGAAYFDKREEAARDKGDKRAVDQVKKERAAFTASGQLPPGVTPPPLVEAIGAARAKLNKAYTEVVKESVKGGQDEAADAAEKDRQKFLTTSSLQFGRRTHLATLKPTSLKNVKPWSGITTLLKLKAGDVPYCVYFKPPEKSVGQMSFSLAGKWTALRVRVGVPEFPDTASPPAGEVIFEVWGDERQLWKSNPTQTLNEYQLAEVCVEKVKTLTLRVHCPNSNDWCRACWLEPVLAE